MEKGSTELKDLLAQCCFEGRLNDPVLDYQWLSPFKVKIFCPKCKNEWVIEYDLKSYPDVDAYYRDDNND